VYELGEINGTVDENQADIIAIEDNISVNIIKINQL